MWVVLACVTFMTCPGSARAELDTLRNYDPRQGYIYYRDPAITTQAARFDLFTPGTIKEIKLLFGGTVDTGSATVHIYGHEGGMNAPLLEQDLIAPIRVTKKHAGVDTISITLPSGIFLKNSQFFIAVDKITPGIALLSDRREKRPICKSATDYFGYQYFKLANNQWQYGDYGYAIDVIMEYPERLSAPYLSDVTAEVGLPDSIKNTTSIAWSDLDNDTYLDALVDGRLFHNDGGKKFTDITLKSRLKGRPRAAAFLDINNDTRLDILYLGGMDDDSASHVFINDGNGEFSQKVLDIPPISNPSSVSIADADNDGYLDLFVGQWSGDGDSLPSYLLVNNHHSDFTDQSPGLYGSATSFNGSTGSQWIDYDADNRPDLFIRTSRGNVDELWHNGGNATFSNDIKTLRGASQASSGIGCHWADYNNDGILDGFLPESIPVEMARDTKSGSGLLLTSRKTVGTGTFEKPVISRIADYQAKQAGATWGDIDNDGRPDIFVTSSCPCHYAELYLQQADHSFALHSYEYGLTTVAAGEDGIWVDYDNNGKLDLATFVDGRFKLLKNSTPTSNNYVAIDLSGANAVGSKVTVYAGGEKYVQQVSSGRGVLMQDPLRLHFGLRDAKQVDSVGVDWATGSSETFSSLSANAVNRLSNGSGLRDRSATLTATISPNPFSTSTTFGYSISTGEHVQLTVYALDGKPVRQLIDAPQEAGEHQILWDGRDQQGIAVPAGAYIYRLITDDGEARGRVLVVR